MRTVISAVTEQRRGYALGLASVVIVTLVIAALPPAWRVANLSMLYLIGVLATAIVAGRGPAVVTSVAAFLTYNWLFVEPVHTLGVAQPSEWFALVLFLVTGAITSELAGGQRRKSLQSAQREREATLLYAVAHVLTGPDLAAGLRAVADQLREALELRAVVIQYTTESGEQRITSGDPELIGPSVGSMRAWMASATSPTQGRDHRWIRVMPPTRGVQQDDRVHIVPLRAGERRAGALAVARGEGRAESANDRLLTAVAAQVASALERARLRDRATEAEVLQRADELKTRLLNAVSHDLRTPLASIVASAGSLRQRDVEWTDAERDEFAADIEEQATRLSRIVTNLLDLSRMESGARRPARGWYDVSALVDDVVGRLRPMAGRHVVSVAVPDDLPPVPLDYIEIDEVLSNLIENALHHTPAGTHVEISATVEGHDLVILVSDDGPGIPPESIAHVFDPFARLAVRQDGKSGLGLGLAVARGLVEAHGGHIAVHRRSGGGTTFRFTLPLEAAVAPAAAR
jgi:two-component system sensor histidine kinase KdpD